MEQRVVDGRSTWTRLERLAIVHSIVGRARARRTERATVD
jgi:hypothetical protein